MNLKQLRAMFVSAGCRSLYAKPLAENDNSKNQVYFAGAVEVLNVFPSQQIFAENTARGPSFKARLKFGWLLENGGVAPVPGAQLILYAQYPEVRFSGFLKGCEAAPSKLMLDRGRARAAGPEIAAGLVGRILFLGVADDGRVIGYVAAGNSELASDFNSHVFEAAFVVFRKVPLPNATDEAESRNRLLTELSRIHRLGWIDSKQLALDGKLKPCSAPQCGGFTLEAEFGIAKNSKADPDFLGWEIKQHSVSDFERPDSSASITMMTPEPSGGFYAEQGVEAFVRKFGYADKKGRPDRLNFGGIHRVGSPQALTKLRLQLSGYDIAAARITDAKGAIALVNDAGEAAALWDFSRLFVHWSRKHTKAVYVPSRKRDEPLRQYAYGNRVRLAQRTDSLRLLGALASGAMFYDPGIKVENASTNPKVKPRSQFRVASKDIYSLYEKVETVVV